VTAGEFFGQDPDARWRPARAPAARHRAHAPDRARLSPRAASRARHRRPRRHGAHQPRPHRRGALVPPHRPRPALSNGDPGRAWSSIPTISRVRRPPRAASRSPRRSQPASDRAARRWQAGARGAPPRPAPAARSGRDPRHYVADAPDARKDRAWIKDGGLGFGNPSEFRRLCGIQPARIHWRHFVRLAVITVFGFAWSAPNANSRSNVTLSTAS
jgi:hypothetical protein